MRRQSCSMYLIQIFWRGTVGTEGQEVARVVERIQRMVCIVV